MVQIDLKDRKILAELDLNARMPFSQLAKNVGLSRQVVEYRIDRMKKEGMIFGAKAIFDSVKAGFNWYRIAFRLLNISEKEKNEFIQYLKNNEYVFWLGEVGGNWDIVVNFICKDNFKFNGLFEEIIEKYGAKIRDYEILIYINVCDFNRAYLLPEKKGRNEFFHEMKYDSEIKIDEVDIKIISELSEDAWQTNIELAKKLNLAPNTIKNRIDSMMKSKLLLGFRLFINPSALGYKSHMLFLEINKLDLEKEKELHNYLESIPNITFVVKHIGKWRIGLEIETKDEKEFQDIFVNIRGKFSDIITNFELFPLFRDHKINYFPEGNLK
ncbi:MAG: AsnC family transcriptional regulator [archaeon]